MDTYLTYIKERIFNQKVRNESGGEGRRKEVKKDKGNDILFYKI